jgi:RHS repeat-associated protein
MELESVDNTLSGVGNDLKLAHSYNSFAGPYGLSGDLATNWGFSPGRDVSLGLFTGTVAYYGPSGTADVFLSLGSGTYRSPPGANATLTKLGDNTFELKHDKSERLDKFDTTGRLTSMKDRNGNTITIAYSSTSPNQITTITDTRGRVTSFSYTAGKITTITDPLSRTYQFAYDNNYTYLLTYTDPNGGVYTYSYDNTGTVDEIQTPEGNRTLITYDTAGRVNHVQRVKTTSPQTVDDYDFDWFTDYTTVTDPNSHTTRYDFEPTQGKVDTVTDALGNDRSVTYTSNSDVATAVDAIGAGNTTTSSYNPNNTLASTTIPTGASAAFTYTDSSHPFSATTLTDAQGNSSLMTYDGPGNLSSVKDTTGGASTTLASYTYNPASPSSPTCGGKYGQRCTMVDGRSKTTSFAYDSSGNLTSVTPPSPLGATSFGSYDSASRVGTVTDGKSQVTRYTYDHLDHVTEIKFGGATTCTPSSGNCVQYTYDDDGNMLTMVDSTGTTTYAYDKLNRQTSKSFPGGGTAASVTYDGVGNVLTYADAGGTVTYAYDAANHLTSLAEPSGSCTSVPKVKCTEFEYDENGKRKKTTYPGSTVMATTYDNSGRPSRVKTMNGLTTIADFQYTYTKNSNDTALVQTMINTAGATTTYTYDTLGQLSKAVLGGGSPASWLYCYDLAGNRTSYSTVSGATCPGATTTYTYNDANELTAKNGSSTGWTYDSNGNETAGVGSATRTSETYNTKNQYTGATVGGTAATMSYAGRDNTERVSASGVTFQNTMLGLASRTSGGSTTYYTRDPDGTLISVRSSTGSSYYVFDGIGSVAALVSSAGVAVNSYTYDPYGAIRSSTETVTNNFKFTGAYYDSDRALYKLGMRYYDPSLGRFTQQDPTGQEANMYVYAGNNPVNFVDPTGGDFSDFFSWSNVPSMGTGLLGGITAGLEGWAVGNYVGLMVFCAFGGPAALPLIFGVAFAVGGAAIGAYVGYNFVVP